MAGRRMAALLLSGVVLATATGQQRVTASPSTTPAQTAREADQPVDIAGRPGVQLFQWTWPAIATECPSLARLGFGFVQTSPPQESITGQPWWTSYQPVSYQLTSKLGSRDQFAEMVAACNAAGVAVIADAVINHMAAGDGVGFAGTAYQHYRYPGLWEPADFHHCGLTADDDIANYQDAAQVQTCELVNLADLDTSKATVRRRLGEYLADLLDLGVDGFRIDAAKHISPADLAAILAEAGQVGTGNNASGARPFAVFAEVIRGGGEPITPEQYLGLGRVYEFGYARALAGSMSTVIPATLVSIRNGLVPSGSAVSFVDNHDTERNGQSVGRRQTALHRLAEIFLLADDYGVPMILSGYDFDDRDQGPPMDAAGRVAGADCAAGPWTCAHRAAHIAALLDFRASVGEAAAATAAFEEVVAITRGDRGLAAINLSGGARTAAVPTTMPAGRYCNILATDCATSDAVIVVADGLAMLTVPGNDAVVIDVDHQAT